MATTYHVRLKPGCTHGAHDDYKDSAEFFITEQEKLAFGDKFIFLGGPIETQEATAVKPTAEGANSVLASGLVVNPANPNPETEQTAVDPNEDLTKAETVVDPDANSSDPDSEETVNVRGINIDDVIAMIKAGNLNPAIALTSEEASGRARPSLVKQLKAMLKE